MALNPAQKQSENTSTDVAFEQATQAREQNKTTMGQESFANQVFALVNERQDTVPKGEDIHVNRLLPGKWRYQLAKCLLKLEQKCLP